MVVGVDRLAVVGRGARGAQVVGGPVDRVRRVPAVGRAVAFGVHAVLRPRRREELHRPARARRVDRALLRARGVGVAPVVALDLADPREYRPVEAVAGGRLEVETQVFGRDFGARLRGHAVPPGCLRRRPRRRAPCDCAPLMTATLATPSASATASGAATASRRERRSFHRPPSWRLRRRATSWASRSTEDSYPPCPPPAAWPRGSCPPGSSARVVWAPLRRLPRAGHLGAGPSAGRLTRGTLRRGAGGLQPESAAGRGRPGAGAPRARGRSPCSARRRSRRPGAGSPAAATALAAPLSSRRSASSRSISRRASRCARGASPPYCSRP